VLVDLIRVPDPTCIDDLLDEPLGILYLAGLLREAGYEVRITNLAGHSWDSWQTELQEADLYGIQLYTPTVNLGVQIAHYIKQNFPGKPIMGGGAHPSALPNSPDLDVFDYLVIGEGEKAVITIADAVKEKKAISRVQKADFIEDLDSLPFPARDLIDMFSFHRKVDGNRCFGVIGSRGCCYRCSFCDHALFGDRVRYRSIENIVEELRRIQEKFGVRHVEFFDDMWTISKKRLVDFAEQTKGMNLNYRCNGRTDILDPEIYELLAQSGCKLICYGIESGSQMILDRMRKQTTVEQNLEAIKMAQKAGIIVAGYFLLGFPGETKETIQETIDFVERSNIDQAQFYTFIPLPGCEVYKFPERFGVNIISHNFSDYYLVTGSDGRGGKTIETSTLSADELAEEMKKIREYLRNRNSRGSMQDYYKKNLGYTEK